MFSRTPLVVALLGCTLSAAPAQTTTTPTTPLATANAPSAAPAGSTDKYAAIRDAKVTMAQAVEVAERTGGQGKAIDVEFERPSGSEPAHYEIKVVYPDGKLVEHKVDANAGTVLKSENQPFERYFTRLKPADFQAAKASLREAVKAAEGSVGNSARAVEAEVEKDGSAVIYEIELASASGKHEVRIDANGQLVAR
jgi:uncharacterized membrane protein YkoI